MAQIVENLYGIAFRNGMLLESWIVEGYEHEIFADFKKCCEGANDKTLTWVTSIRGLMLPTEVIYFMPLGRSRFRPVLVVEGRMADASDALDLGKRRAAMHPIAQQRPSIEAFRTILRLTVAAFLKRQAPVISAQLADALILGKADTGEVTDPVDGLDFSRWSELVEPAAAVLAQIAVDGGGEALKQVGVSTAVHEAKLRGRSEAWARARAAEMVGMKWVDGELVPNPNAKWQITESTRDTLRSLTEKAIAEGWSTVDLADAVTGSSAFSDSRAEMIARTETALADSEGALQGYRESGIVKGKRWLTAEDDLVSEECQSNAAAGVIDLDESFPEGVDAPPQHPSCRCVVLPVLDDDGVGGATS